MCTFSESKMCTLGSAGLYIHRKKACNKHWLHLVCFQIFVIWSIYYLEAYTEHTPKKSNHEAKVPTISIYLTQLKKVFWANKWISFCVRKLWINPVLLHTNGRASFQISKGQSWWLLSMYLCTQYYISQWSILIA